MDKLLWLLVPMALTAGMMYYVFRLSGRSMRENLDYTSFIWDRAENGGHYPESWEEYENELDIIERYEQENNNGF